MLASMTIEIGPPDDQLLAAVIVNDVVVGRGFDRFCRVDPLVGGGIAAIGFAEASTPYRMELSRCNGISRGKEGDFNPGYLKFFAEQADDGFSATVGRRRDSLPQRGNL